MLSLSLSQVLREVDRRCRIRSDFVLVSADLVSNMDLGPVLEQHRARRAESKDNILTMVLNRAVPGMQPGGVAIAKNGPAPLLWRERCLGGFCKWTIGTVGMFVRGVQRRSSSITGSQCIRGNLVWAVFGDG